MNANQRAVRALIAAAIGASAFQIATGAVAQGPVPCGYEVTHVIQAPLGPPPGSIPITIGTGISPSGRYVCGFYQYIETRYAFLYDTQTQQFMTLPVTPSNDTVANDVNEVAVVGRVADLGFIYEIATGQITYLPSALPSGGVCQVNAINSSNVVCGTRTIQASPMRTTAFRWSPATGFEDVGLINGESTFGWGISDDGKVVGHYPLDQQSTTTRAIVFQDGVLTLLDPVPGGINSRSRGVAPTGEILVMGLLEPPPIVLQRTFVYDRGVYLHLGVPNGCDRTHSGARNSTGTSVGACNDLSTATWRGVVWYGTSPRVINTMLDKSLGHYVRASIGITLDGLILADTITAQGRRIATVLSPIPRHPGDTNCDGSVNVSDLLNVINNWGPCSGCDTDLNADGVVNVIDLLQVIHNWSP